VTVNTVAALDQPEDEVDEVVEVAAATVGQAVNPITILVKM
jgi:hypothetical protein